MDIAPLHFETDSNAPPPFSFPERIAGPGDPEAQESRLAEEIESLREKARIECLQWRPVKRHTGAGAVDFSREIIGALIERASLNRGALAFLTLDDRVWVL